jgi:DNA-binding winged helix-turn-helix (wHTH) protein/tetratricopeptide (TPR) repeat protein
MTVQSPKMPRYRFGPFELDPGQGTLYRNGAKVRLQDLPYRLLVMLVERPGEIVTREEVRQRLWPENTFVEFDNSLGVAIRKVRDSLDDDAETPRYVETLPRRGYRFLAPVTVVESGSASNLKESAESVPEVVAPGVGQTPTTTGNLSSRSGRSWVIVAFVLMLVGAALYWFRSSPRHSSTKAEAASFAAAVRPRRSVAVLGFRNLPGRAEDNWLSPAFVEMLNTELGAGGGLRMVSGEDVARAKRELPLTDEDSLARATLDRLRINPGADVVVIGSYTLLPNNGENRIRLDIRLQDTARGETVAEEAFTGNENNLFDLAAQAGRSLRQSLGVSSISAEANNAARAALPSNEQSARLYAEGRAKLWAYDFLGARDLLVKAAAADPKYSLVHSALSEALWHLGYEAKSRVEAERARELDDHLPQEQRLLVEGQYQRTFENWPKTVEIYQSLFHLFPDSLDYGLLLASAQMYIKHADALQTLAILRRLPAPSGDDARIDMIEATAWINTDLTKARAAAQRAIDKANAQGSHVLVARTYGILCQQGSNIGSSAEAVSACERALQSSIAAKDRNGEAMMLLDLGGLHYQMGDLAQSEKMFRAAIKEFGQVGNPQGVASALSNLGGSRLTQGDLKEAKQFLEESIPEYQAIEDKEGVALALNNLGDLHRQSGDLGVAETTYQQAKATAQEIDDKSARAYVLNGMGDVFVDRGDLAAARKSYEEALTLRNQIGEKQAAGETQTGLAQLLIEEGHAAEGETLARTCKEQFHRDQQADDELAASTVLAMTLLAQGKYADAQKEISGTEALAGKNQNRFARQQFDLISARVKLASDHPESARPQIEQILQDAQAHGYIGVEFEAKLALSELAMKTGHTAAAQSQLISLEKAAHGKGFDLIARKAAAARG